MTDIRKLAATLARLAATQRNLPVPLTEAERADLRAAARLIVQTHA